MKTIIKLLLFISIVFSSVQLTAQQAEIKRSNNKVNLNGKPYYIHIVRKGETLYAISQVYQIPVDTIKKDNSSISDSLKISQYIKIRISTQQDNNQQKFIYHQVKKGDTPYNLSIKYNVSINDIYLHNPNAKVGIILDELLKIPVAKDQTEIAVKPTPQSVPQTDDFVIHVVQKKETLYGIAAKYGTTQEQIITLNPALKERSIQIGESLKIAVSPKNMHDSAKNDTIKHEPKRDAFAIWKDTLLLRPCPIVDIDKTTTYKVAFFLPFNLNINDTLGKFLDVLVKDGSGVEILESVARTGNIEDKIYSKSIRFIEFYQGALIALKDLKKMGISLDVHVFDTQNDSTYVTKLLKTNNFSDYTLFIGPVYGADLEVVGKYAKKNSINLVSPLLQKNDIIKNNPYAFQVSPPFEIQMHHASEFLNEFDIKNYIVIHDGNNLDQEYISHFKKQLFAQMNDANLNKIKYNEVFYYDARDSVLKEVFTSGIKNIVIVPSSNQAFVTDVMGKLNGYSYDYDITVFGQPQWLSFENIELENFHNTNTHIFSNSFIDYSTRPVIEFVNQYRHYYKSEPDKDAFQGYDITKYFCLALNKYGKDFRKCIHAYQPNILQTHFQFVPYADQGGYQNTAIYILEFTKDFKLKKSTQFPR